MRTRDAPRPSRKLFKRCALARFQASISVARAECDLYFYFKLSARGHLFFMAKVKTILRNVVAVSFFPSPKGLS